MLIPKTLRDALENGYRIDERVHVRGYLSRKINPLDQPVKIAGGSRKGRLFVESPRYDSSTYHYRFYLIKTLDK